MSGFPDGVTDHGMLLLLMTERCRALQAYDMKRPVELPREHEAMRAALEAEEAAEGTDRNAWKREEWRDGEDAGVCALPAASASTPLRMHGRRALPPWWPAHSPSRGPALQGIRARATPAPSAHDDELLPPLVQALGGTVPCKAPVPGRSMPPAPSASNADDGALRGMPSYPWRPLVES